jgi:NitT/TauT family transport system permease protein
MIVNVDAPTEAPPTSGSALPDSVRHGLDVASLVPRRGLIAPTLALLALLVGWEAVVRLARIPNYLLPTPTSILGYTATNLSLLWPHAVATITSTVLGFAAAVVVGILLAIAIVWWKLFEDAVYPLIVMTQVIPKVALAPIIIIYLGFGLLPKVVLAFLVAFFPIVVNSTLGLKSVSGELLELLATLKAGRVQVLWKIRFPRAMPYIVEGAKIAITLAVIGAIVGEFTSGNTGLGYLIEASATSVDTLQGFSALFVLIVVGIVLFEIVHVVGRLLTPWLRNAQP